jgi:Protein of unknown function (DUF3306)
MSEDFLTRWSRRKRDPTETKQTNSAPGERDTISEEVIPENATPAERVETTRPVLLPEPALDLKDLPPIESITAATDIRPFLAPGVPADIARAALRRAWSVDRRIRDFVGLADYDWDYHSTGSAAGFGPLEMTDELRQMVARIVGDIVDADTSKRAGEPATDTERVDESRSRRAEVEQRSPGDRDQPLELPPDYHPASAAAVEPKVAPVALQHETSPGGSSRSLPRRGHGSALPK